MSSFETADLPVFTALLVAVATAYYLIFQKNSRPALPPGYQYVPHLASFVPFIGSAMEFRSGHLRDFVRRSAAKLNAPAFTATIMGEKCLFVAESEYINFIFRDSKQLDGLTLQKQFMRNVSGFGDAEIDLLFDQTAETPKTIMDLFHKYLLKDDALQNFMKTSQEVLLKEINGLASSMASPQDDEPMKLFEFVSAAVFRASAGPLLSMNLNPDHKQHLKDLRMFEKGIGLLFVGAPNFMTPDGVKGRGALISLFMSDMVISSESEFLRERRRWFYKGFGHQEEFKDQLDFAIARLNTGVFLATVGNSIQSIFWTLLNLMEDPQGYAACTEAVQKVAAKREGGRDWFTLEELDELMILQSAFQEALRMYQALFVTRHAIQDFCLNPKDTGTKYMVQKGTSCMILPNVQHMDPEIFEDPHVFKYDRFLDTKATTKKGTRLSSHLRPFGGGVHMCPGRKFIGYEARALLAMLLLKYDMKLRPGETRPNIDFTRQGMSVSVPERDVEFEVQLRG